MFRKIKKFLVEVRQELRKTSWSTKEELIGSTIIVIVAVAVLAIFVGIIDFTLSQLINLLLK